MLVITWINAGGLFITICIIIGPCNCSRLRWHHIIVVVVVVIVVVVVVVVVVAFVAFVLVFIFVT